MPTNDHDHREEADLPPNVLEIITGGNNNNNNTNNNNNNNQQLHLLETLLWVMIFNATFKYARTFPNSLRRVIEVVLLLQAFSSFFILVYVHINFTRIPASCLDHVKDIWPRDGILRVEIIRNSQHSHPEQTGTMNELLQKSYEREYKLKRMDMSEENVTMFNHFTKTNSPEKKGDVDIEQSTEELVENKSGETNINLFNYLSFTDYTNFEAILNSDYIVEYSLEHRFLHLSPSARNRSSIPIMLVALDPTRNKCYRDSVIQFFLEYFFGYDELLLSSVKSLAENEQNKGFFRNVISEEYKRFDRMSKPRTSYITSLLIMVVFTLLISKAMRYLQQQILLFIVFFRQRPVHRSVPSLAMVLLMVALTRPGLKAIMSEIFNDGTTALYVISIVCLADQYVTNISHSPITKKHWLRFFYLYHLSFYAYHFRFNGQFSKLALICSWLFIQHSVVYFYHHYELDVLVVLDRAEQLRRLMHLQRHLYHQRQQQLFHLRLQQLYHLQRQLNQTTSGGS